MQADRDGFLFPTIDPKRCVGCQLCTRHCPVLHPQSPAAEPTAYAAYTKDRALRLKSSSGGIFSEIAKPILISGGAVFGCILEKPELRAIHIKAETFEALAEMRGSKYVQSDIRNTYQEAKEVLCSGRPVLYSGTPCQIAGLHAFLGKAYDNLLSAQLICHGAPAPAVFRKYKQELIREHSGTPLASIAFRNKHYSWRRFSLVSAFADTSENRADLYSDRYIRAFLNDLCLRPSCYTCAARENRSQADFTLADFWGIENVCPELDDSWGTSLVLCHTPKAHAYWQQIAPALNAKRVPFQQAIRGNPSYHSSVRLPKGRAYFMRHVHHARSLEALLERSLRGPTLLYFARRVYRKLRTFLMH